MLLPPETQMILWHGRELAKKHKQAINWDINREMNKSSFRDVYTDLIGEERTMSIVSSMDRKEKELEAERRLREDR